MLNATSAITCEHPFHTACACHHYVVCKLNEKIYFCVLCLHTSKFAFVCVFVFVRVYCMSVCECSWMYIYTRMYVCRPTCVSMYICTCVCIRSMFECMHVCPYLCTCMQRNRNSFIHPFRLFS